MKHLEERFEYIPTLEEMEKGARPEEVIIKSTLLGGPSESREIIFESQFGVDYEKKDLFFRFATQDLGLLKLRLLPKWVPLKHRKAAGKAHSAIFKQKRGTIRMYPVFHLDSGRTLAIGTFEREGEKESMAFDSHEDARLWAQVTGAKLLEIEDVRPRKARDMLFRNLILSKIRRHHLDFLPEWKDKGKSGEDLLEILYDKPNAAELEGSLRKIVSPTAIMESAMENSQDALYSIGFLLDIINKAKSAQEKLQKLGVSKKDMKRAWDFMYLGEVPIPEI